jgi:hypothetical protein
MTMPISFTDSELDIVMSLGAPLDPSARAAYLADVAKELDGLAEVGDGIIARIAREVQGRFCEAFRMPAMTSLSPRRVGRRPKCTKARSRGVWGTDSAAGAMRIAC